MKPIAIHWFRQDLRLADNPALTLAAQHNAVLPIYIQDPNHPIGAASKIWLHHSLQSLSKALSGNLSYYQGNPLDILLDLVKRYPISTICWNRCYEPQHIQRDSAIKQRLAQQNLNVHSTNGSLLWEPWTIQTQAQTPYKIFTPYYQKGCLNAPAPPEPSPAPQALYQHDAQHALSLEALKLLPKKNWDHQITQHWTMGEHAAQQRFDTFLDHGLSNYQTGRDFPSAVSVSYLSPHLHFGEIAPHRLWHMVKSHGDSSNHEHFCRELAWREFSYYLLYHCPTLPTENLNPTLNAFPWQQNPKHLKAWQQGQTGIPLVDAGMRELWHTGYMHNRVRMITASFLIKHLNHHWRNGADWFWETLFDADLASNSVSWQWVAGCGTDASPFFRIFNPVLQAKKFDPEGHYLRTYLPELAKLPNKHLFSPWLAPEDQLKAAGVTLGTSYPHPIIDLNAARQQTLQYYGDLRKTPQSNAIKTNQSNVSKH